ncbi:hypothetical protein PPSIR1_26763 [Plesiocystis pacifica SIR-1]|uniref:Uncharacterized protein n=1 Tax=Plesiocystis pacifica SIR-1 TaxID=391625 RepID=A6GAB8_9BACT|nr:hypothetical protein PPSIR1_26763 [Plesiocystis pacifica SIR-1]
MIAAMILFAVMWVGILFAAYRLFRWLIALDRQVRDGEAPIEPGL